MPRPTTAPATAPWHASPPDAPAITAPAAAPFAPEPALPPCGGGGGGGADGLKPVWFVAICEHSATSFFCWSADWPFLGVIVCAEAASANAVAISARCNGRAR